MAPHSVSVDPPPGTCVGSGGSVAGPELGTGTMVGGGPSVRTGVGFAAVDVAAAGADGVAVADGLGPPHAAATTAIVIAIAGMTPSSDGGSHPASW